MNLIVAFQSWCLGCFSLKAMFVRILWIEAARSLSETGVLAQGSVDWESALKLFSKGRWGHEEGNRRDIIEECE